MSNPRINLRLLRQALSSQFASLTFRNGERDDFRAPFQELSNSQKHSLISLGNEIAEIEINLRISNRFDADTCLVPIAIAKMFLISVESTLLDTCKDCEDPALVVALDKSGSFKPCCATHITDEI